MSVLSRLENFDETAHIGQDICPMCGAFRIGELPDRAEHADTEIIRRLASFASEDWKACAILLLYVSSPNATVAHISGHISLSPASICSARKRAAERFPELSGMLGLKTPRALAQQARYTEPEKTEIQGELL